MMPSQSLRILILEDDLLDAELAILKLEQDGFSCDWQRVDTRASFTDCLENGDYDLVLADYNLPSFDGLGALKIFVEKALDIPFIIVSGNLGEEIAVETLRSGATDYVLKDRLSSLPPAVRRALDEKEAQRQRCEDEKKIKRLLQHQLAVNTLSISLGELRELEDIYQAIFHYIGNMMDIDTFILSFFDERTGLIHAGYVVTDGVVHNIQNFPPILLALNGLGTQSQVIRSGKPIYFSDHREALAGSSTEYVITESGDVIKGPPPDDQLEQATKSSILVPLKDKGKTIGVLQVQSYKLDGYTQDDHEILGALANVAAIAIQNARLINDAQRQLRKLESLHNIDIAISASIDVQITLNILLEQVEAQLDADACSIALLLPDANMLEYKAGRGFLMHSLTSSEFRLGEGLVGRIALERNLIHIADLSKLDEASTRLFAQEQFVSYYGMPLISKGQVKGILEIFYRSAFELDQEWLDFLETLATQAAIAIDNANLFHQLQRSNIELTLAYDTTLEGWAKALELRDRETVGHGRRVTELTVRMSRALGLPDAEIVHIRRGALLHDIGKMGIPDTILQKPGPLTDEEMEIMRQHVMYANEWLSPIRYLKNSLDIPYCHHERWDGQGYPRGLRGERIPISARIFAVIDVWDALTSDRPYRMAWSREETIAYIREQSGKHFDPRVAEAFLNLIQQDQNAVQP